jgi:hypothetical protein
MNDPHAAGLASSTGVDLGLHGPCAAADFLGTSRRAFGGHRHTRLGEGKSVIPQHRLGLVLVKVHG